jgi:hypothetical protein
MAGDEPTLGEVMRRLEHVSTDLQRVTTELKNDYVPRREYELRFKNVEGDVADINKAREVEGTFRRQVLLGLALTLLSSIGALVVALSGRV